MERPDSISLHSVLAAPRHEYTAINREDEQTMDQSWERRSSQDRMDAHSDQWERVESTETLGIDNPAQGPTEGRLRGMEKSKSEMNPSATLHRSGYILFLTLIYIALAVFSWVVTCYLSFRPITAAHYGEWIWNSENNGYGWSSYTYLMSLYEKNQRWYHGARVIQSIVGVLTIPVTSAVCSSAAVIFIQKRHSRGGLTMRQVMTIADKGWTDIPTYLRAFPLFGTKGWKRYGSSFLFLACFINLLGLAIPPLQEIFLSTSTIKTPTWPSEVLFLLDIPDQFKYKQYPDYRDTNLIVVLTRSNLASTTNVQRQAQIWQGANISCALTPEQEILPQSCNRGGITFGNMSELENPFLAQLPSGYSTGLVQQFLPRINSTAQYEKISADQFPKACDQIDGSFYVDYLNVTDWGHGYSTTWGLEACMPADLRKSPWKSTRDRQDFTEELYLNVTLIGYDFMDYYSSSYVNSSFYKITLDTTAGYFELPNYMNGEVAGPLLDKDPSDICGNSCEAEGYGTEGIYNHGPEPKAKRDGESIAVDPSRPLEAVVNKGPLLTIAMALFGEGSFIPVRQAYPQAYAADFNSTEQVKLATYSGACESLAPFGFLLADNLGQNVIGNSVDYCITNTDGGLNHSDLDNEVASWISNFNYDEERLANAFTSAAFLANQAWLENNVDTGDMSLTITFDMGHDTQIPVISRAGLILVSILLCLDILILLPLAVYATFTPRWTSTLDSFAMMRLGAAVADKVPLLVGRETDRIDVLDKIPGCVGDQSEESDVVGKLGLGAPRPLSARKNKRFESYPGDRERLSAQELKIHQKIYQEGRRNIQV